ncbi:hypothetical protein BC332_32053 [Capsicum chinense]|nr:hypothetical protein BC332_32053 [Capsicum chinense]
MTVEDLIVRLRIEEDNKTAERRSKGNSTINGAHIVKDDQNNFKKRKKVEQRSNQPKKKFKEKFFNCGKIGHKSIDCRTPKKGKKKDQANMIESNKECDDLYAMFSECNLTANPREWWMDSGATRHIQFFNEVMHCFEQVHYLVKCTSRGRVYLPQDELAQAGLGLFDGDIFAGRVADKWRIFMKKQIQRARKFFDEAEKEVTELSASSRWPNAYQNNKRDDREIFRFFQSGDWQRDVLEVVVAAAVVVVGGVVVGGGDGDGGGEIDDGLPMFLLSVISLEHES